MSSTQEHPAVRRVLIGAALAFLGVLVALPLAGVFVQALRAGLGPYLAALATAETRAAIRLTLLVTAIVVPLNAAFGLAAAWANAKFRFRGQALLLALIDVPLGVSPVIAGLLFVLLFGRTGWLGPWLAERGWRVLFAPPGLVLATLFVTLPLVAREVLTVMQAQGSAEEEAALTLGASGWQTFVRVTLPKIRWGLLYGVVLCAARAMGEFGAVSVVSGHIRGLTNTMPLQIEILYNEYDQVAAFALASLLALLAVATLLAKRAAQGRTP